MLYARARVCGMTYSGPFVVLSFSAILHCPAGSSHVSGKVADVCTCSRYASAGTFPHKTLYHLNIRFVLISLSLLNGPLSPGAAHVAGEGGGQDCVLHVVHLPLLHVRTPLVLHSLLHGCVIFSSTRPLQLLSMPSHISDK